MSILVLLPMCLYLSSSGASNSWTSFRHLWTSCRCIIPHDFPYQRCRTLQEAALEDTELVTYQPPKNGGVLGCLAGMKYHKGEL